MKRTMIALMALLLISASASAAILSSTAQVALDAVDAEPGQAAAVDIRLSSSDLTMAGLQLPLQFAPALMTVDSVSFDGSLKPSGTVGTALIDNVAGTVLISYYPQFSPTPFAVVDAEEGLLATLHLTIAADAPQGPASIDSVYSGLTDIRFVSVAFTDSEGRDIYMPAGFSAGTVTVQTPTDVADADAVLPTDYSLSQNYPNPFNPSTVIQFTLPTAGHVTLNVYNVLGQRVASLVDGHLRAGVHQYEFDASGQTSGVYFYRLTHEAGSSTQKMILMK